MFKHVATNVLNNVICKHKHEQEFFGAVIIGDLKVIHNIIKFGINPNIVDDEGLTALQIVAEKNDLIVGKHLLKEKKVDVNYHTLTRNRDTALITAVTFDRLQFATMLLQHKADPNLLNSFDQTALHRAVRRQNYQMVKALLFAKASPNIQDVFGNTPLSLAVLEYPSRRIVKVLLEWDADPNFETIKQQPLIIELALYCRSALHLHLMKQLLIFKGDINIQNLITGQTPLHMVSITGYLPLAKLLLKLGAGESIKDRMGRSAFDMAVQHEQFDLVRFYKDRRRIVRDIIETIGPESVVTKKDHDARRNVRFSDRQAIPSGSKDENF